MSCRIASLIEGGGFCRRQKTEGVIIIRERCCDTPSVLAHARPPSSKRTATHATRFSIGPSGTTVPTRNLHVSCRDHRPRWSVFSFFNGRFANRPYGATKQFFRFHNAERHLRPFPTQDSFCPSVGRADPCAPLAPSKREATAIFPAPYTKNRRGNEQGC